jgi:hypothetical protein
MAEDIPRTLCLKADEWVEVRSKAEILTTLDKNGRLEELPFMPQMLECCGRKLQVHKHAHKLCSFATQPPGNRMSNAVNLKGVQCDGQAYGGCEMRCMILWKEAWLKRADPSDLNKSSWIHGESGNLPADPERSSTESDIWAGTRAGATETGEPVYVCQATQLPFATQPLSRWAFKQYIEDYVSGNASVSKILSVLSFHIFDQCLVASGVGFGSLFRWMFDVFQRLRGGRPYPCRRGQVPRNQPTPSASLNLQIGELVRVKEHGEILKTLNHEGMNRGMSFHPELSLHCGKTYRVLQRPRKIIDEKSGRLTLLKNECIVLDGADCQGQYTNPLNCARASYPYWREIWLERVPEKTCSTSEKRVELS